MYFNKGNEEQLVNVFFNGIKELSLVGTTDSLTAERVFSRLTAYVQKVQLALHWKSLPTTKSLFGHIKADAELVK